MAVNRMKASFFAASLFAASLFAASLFAGRYKLLLLFVFFPLCSCSFHLDTKVRLAQTANPPSFKLTGTGSTPMLVLVGPYDDKYDRSTSKKMWEIEASGNTAEKPLWQLPEIIYGKLPKGFIQKYPEQLPPASLEEDKAYCLFVNVHGAKAGHMCFQIKHGQASKVEFDFTFRRAADT